MAVAAAVPWFVWVLVLAGDLAVVALVALAVLRHGGAGARGRARAVGAALSLWFVVAAALSGAGAFAGTAGPVPAVGLGVFLPILAGIAALAASRSLRAAVLAIPQRWLIGIQAVRVIGLVFLFELARGALPARFALPAGWGDFAVGAAALLVARAVSTTRPWGTWLALAWNALGLLDLAVAVGVGALSAEGPLRVFLDDPPTTALAQLPLSMIPVFGVPLFVLLHVASIYGLRAAAGRRHGAAGPEAPSVRFTPPRTA